MIHDCKISLFLSKIQEKIGCSLLSFYCFKNKIVESLWVVKAWRSEDVALYGKVVSPPLS